MKCVNVKASDIQREWFIIDAEGLVLGRMAAEVSKLLRGKHKPTYSNHLDCGDNVVIINADKVKMTGAKRADKIYHWHTGYPGGIKQRSAEQILSGQFPERVVRKAIERMITRNPLGRAQMRKLFVYAGSEHPHEAQKPKALDIAAQNKKNKKED